MAVEEVGRRLIGGVWVTNVQAEGSGGGGGGSVSEVTSDDGTVSVIDPTGPTVDLSATNPGVDPPASPTDGMLWWDTDDDTPAPSDTQPWKIVRVPLAFDTPGLVADAGGASVGIAVWTPEIGDTLLPIVSYFSITTAWDGTSPFLSTTLSDYDGAISGFPLDQADGPDPNWGAILAQAQVNDGNGNLQLFGFSGIMPVIGVSPLRFVVSDGSGGDPGSMQGAGELVLVLLAAP